jgi:hypothetical protein
MPLGSIDWYSKQVGDSARQCTSILINSDSEDRAIPQFAGRATGWSTWQMPSRHWWTGRRQGRRIARGSECCDTSCMAARRQDSMTNRKIHGLTIMYTARRKSLSRLSGIRYSPFSTSSTGTSICRIYHRKYGFWRELAGGQEASAECRASRPKQGS